MSVGQEPVLLLTGASRGIGHATVKRFSSEGWRVLTISRQAFDHRCPWPGGERNHIQLDLSDVDGVRDALPEIKRIAGGRLDALINNAAVSPKHANGGKITSLEMAYKDWLHIFNVNFFSAILLAQGLSDYLIEFEGQHCQHDLDRRIACASFRQRGLCDVEGRNGGADPGNGQ